MNNNTMFDASSIITLSVKQCGKLTSAKGEWLPEVLDGPRLSALKNNIKQHGQLHPIIIDTDNTVWDGRSRLQVCKALGIPVKAIKVSPDQGLESARSGALQREMTVLDEVNLVEWARSQPEVVSGKGEEKEKISRYLQGKFGKRRMSSSQVRDILRLSKHITGKADKTVVRKATSVTDALSKLDPSKKETSAPLSKAAGKLPNTSQPIKVLQKAEETIAKLAEEVDQASGDELVEACKRLQSGIRKFLSRKPKSAS